jgi:hypothetical protein
MEQVMAGRVQLIGLVAVSLGLAGCGATTAPDPSVAATAEQSPTGAAPSRPGGQPAAEAPCGDAVAGQVQQTLGLESTPAPESAWADNRHTCTYRTPMGPLVLTVTVESTEAAAQDREEALRAELGATSPVSGRQDAYKNGLGVVVARVDDLVLSVDASALPPEHLGPDHQSDTGVAIVLATGVLDGWTGQG